MHQFVQSAIEAAKQGDKNKAMSFLKEVLAANPTDVDAWLVLAAVVDEPQRKRQCLNRVLALDPVNQIARDELFEMDRDDMGITPPFKSEPDPGPFADSSASSLKPQSRSQPSMSLESNRPAERPTPTQARHVTLPQWEEEKPKVKPVTPQRSAPKPQEKPQVFKYALSARIIIYVMTVVFLCSFLLALQDVTLLLLPCGASFLILPGVWIVSKEVALSEKGIRVSQLFGLIGTEVGWNEIARIKSNSMQRNLALTTKDGKTVKVTTQVIGYPTIVEALRQKRPDLFGSAPAASRTGNVFAAEVTDSPSLGSDIPAAPASFNGKRTFKKSSIKQYGLLFFVIPLGVLSVLAAFEPQYRLGAIITAVVCFLFVLLPFFQVGLVKVEPNKLTVESFLEQKEFSAKEIREIKMASVRGRYGRVTNYVNIVPVKGKNYPIQGFKDGDEIIYGILHQWWESYRNR